MMKDLLEHAPDLTDDQRAKALSRTDDLMQKLDAIRKRLEMPPDTIGLVVDVYKQEAKAVQHQAFAEEHRKRLQEATKVLPWKIVSQDTERKPIKIKGTCQVVVRPQWTACRVIGLEIDGDPTRWVVHSIKVGNREQQINPAEDRPIPGERFRKGGLMTEVKLETIQTAMDFAITVAYVGPEPEGEMFEMTATAKVYDLSID